MAHQFQYTLELLRSVIHHMPKAFPRERHEQMDSSLKEMEESAGTTKEEIEKTILEFGKEIWPYVEAYEEMYRRHGEAKEGEIMRAKLPDHAREVFEKFLAEGGKVENVRGGAKFEAIDPEVRAAVVAAELSAHDSVHDDLDLLVAGDGKPEYDQLLEDHRKKFTEIEAKLAEFRRLAEKAGKWAPEILDKANTFEQGFAYVERAPSLDDIKKEIEYYVDIIE